jgi:hypothetical protein
VDGSGVIVAASNTAITLTANSVANNQFQTGSIENYMRAQGSSSVFAGMRNRIINGAMTIDQRNNGGAVTPSNAQYTLDRWDSQLTQSSKYSVQQDSSANTVAGFSNSLKVTSLSSYSITSSDIFNIFQNIEGLNCTDLNWGTANAKTVTLSFWVRSSLTGTFGGSIQNNGVDRSYPFSYTILAADTWEQKFIVIPGDTTGTWLTTNAVGIRVWFGLGVVASYSGTAGAWTSGDKRSATGATSVVGTNGATWYITGVQFEAGSTPTPFEFRQYGTELALCQRYYVDINTFRKGGSVSTDSSGRYIEKFVLPVTMRGGPTLTWTRTGGRGADGFIAYPASSTTITTSVGTKFGTSLEHSSIFCTAIFYGSNANVVGCIHYYDQDSTASASAEL